MYSEVWLWYNNEQSFKKTVKLMKRKFISRVTEITWYHAGVWQTEVILFIFLQAIMPVWAVLLNFYEPRIFVHYQFVGSYYIIFHWGIPLYHYFRIYTSCSSLQFISWNEIIIEIDKQSNSIYMISCRFLKRRSHLICFPVLNFVLFIVLHIIRLLIDRFLAIPHFSLGNLFVLITYQRKHSVQQPSVYFGNIITFSKGLKVRVTQSPQEVQREEVEYYNPA